MMQTKKEQKLILKICAVAMMAAIVFVGNYLRIKIPVSLGGTTSFTLANILCALAGLLLGPWWGGLGRAWALPSMTCWILSILSRRRSRS